MDYELSLIRSRLQKAAGMMTPHGAGYDKFMSTFPGQRNVKPYQAPVDPGFTNKQTSQEAFQQQKSSVPYVSVNKDATGNPYFNGAQTQKNIYGGDADFQRRAEAQMARARMQQALGTGLSQYKGQTLDHPVTLNPGNKDRRWFWDFRNFGTSTSSNPNRNVPIRIGKERSNYDFNKDVISVESNKFPTDGTPIPETLRTLPWPEAVVQMPSASPGEDLYRGIYNNFERPNPWYEAENVLQEEATHAQSPTMHYTNIPKDNDPNVFAPKDRLSGEYWDENSERNYREKYPIVPGMQGTYDQWPGEFVKSRKLDQNDAQATYGHRIQNAKELLDYHNMNKVYGTDEEWRNAQKNLTLQHAQALGRLRAVSERQRQQDWEKQKEAPLPANQMPLRPVQSLYDFTNQTDLMRQVRHTPDPNRLEKVAAALRHWVAAEVMLTKGAQDRSSVFIPPPPPTGNETSRKGPVFVPPPAVSSLEKIRERLKDFASRH